MIVTLSRPVLILRGHLAVDVLLGGQVVEAGLVLAELRLLQ